MGELRRCAAIWLAGARNELTRALTFRVNAAVLAGVEVLWFGILLAFYDTLFRQSPAGTVAGWSRAEFLFFLGCYFALEGILETFVLRNCAEFAELVRSGRLDALLLKPADAQFLVTLRLVDLRAVPNIVLGVATMWRAVSLADAPLGVGQLAAFAALFAAAAVLAYSLLVALMSLAVFTIRQQSLHELWWLLTTFWRNPPELFDRASLSLVRGVFTYVIPVMLIVQVPASAVVSRVYDPTSAGVLVFAAGGAAVLSRRGFRRALRHYSGTGS